MPEHDENFWRSLPTWELICELMGERHIPEIKAVLRERIQALGALDLIGLVYIEAVHSGTPQPLLVDWDPAIVNAGITLPNDGDDGIRPLHLQWDAERQLWAAAAVFEAGLETIDYYPTIAEADAAYRALVGLQDAGRHTEVFVNDEEHCRVIVEGRFVPALDTPVEGEAVAPLHLKWDAKTQKWAATVVRRGVRETFGYYATVADADAVYRAIVQLHDAGRATKVHINREKHLRTIVEGRIVPALEAGRSGT